MPKDKDAKRKRRQRKAAEKRSVSRDSDAAELSTRRAAKIQSANRTKRKWHQQTGMSRERNVKEKEFQELTQSTAVPARRSGFLPI